MKSTTTKEWGVKHPSGYVESISEFEANEGYMSAQEYASVRARTVGGSVVTQTTTVTMSEWVPADSKIPTGL